MSVSHTEALGILLWGVAWFAAYEFGGGGGGASMYRPGDAYAARVRRAISPLVPGVFGIVWLVLYALNAVASYHYWRDFARTPQYTWAFALLLVNIVTNKAWSALFFGTRSPTVAFVDILLVLGTAIAILVAMALGANAARSGWLAFGLFAPYVVWLLLATGLNLRFLLLD